MILEDIIKAAMTITPLTLDKNFIHMKQPWEMILGGLILPILAEEQPEVLTDEYRKLIDQYTKDKVVEFFTPKEIVKEIVKEIPADCPTIKETIIRVKSPSEKIGGKHRRIKGKIKKEIKKDNDLKPEDRDIFIRHWNTYQHLVADGNPICEQLSNECDNSIAPAQVAGYFSYLCRLGRAHKAIRDSRIDKSIKKGTYTIRPEYSPELLKEIQENWTREREDERIRKEAHAKILSRERLVEIVEESPAPEDKDTYKSEPDLDIAKIDFM